jgi:hypothetical protein
MRALLCLAVLSSTAAADPLTSSVAKMTPEPIVAIVPVKSGKTAVDRYRANVQAVSANTPLVALVKLNEANGPDVISVADAHRDGSKISITIENRRFDGGLDKNVTYLPLVEVELGALKPGNYTFDIEEKILHFDKDPKAAKYSGPGLAYKATLAIQ